MIRWREWLHKLYFPVLLFVSFALLTLIVVTQACRRTATFNVEAHTERVDIQVSRVTSFQWPLDAVDVVEGQGQPIKLTDSRPFSGSLKIDPPARIQIERVAFGPVTIDIENMNGGSVGQWYEQDEPSGRAGRVVLITVANLPQRAVEGKRLILPLSGNVSTGRQIGSETNETVSLLRSGTVTVLAEPLVGDTFQASTRALYAGDHFAVLPGNAADEMPEALGFVVADERPALTAVYRVVGPEGQVTRPGGTQYAFGASLFDLVTHDRLLQGLVSAIAFVGAGVTLMVSVFEVRKLWRAALRRPRSKKQVNDSAKTQ